MHLSLDTPRLHLRPLTLADAPTIQAQFGQWDVIKYFPRHVPWPYVPGSAEAYLRDKVLPEMHKGVRYSWAITLRTDPKAQLMGVIELTFATPYDQRAFWLGQAWQGLGFMTEASFMVNDFALLPPKRAGLGMPDLLFCSADANTPSNQLKVRSGAVPIQHGEYDFHAGRLPITRWQLTDSAWAKTRSALWKSLSRWNPADFSAP
jgi:ribosomal-protein-alanine N-acetyltransferase